MSETSVIDRNLDLGLNSYKILFDRETNKVTKIITSPLEWDKGQFESPDRFTFQRTVGGSVSLITDPRWGFRDLLPDNIDFEIVENPRLSSGYEAHIKADYIEGKSLSSQDTISEFTARQLVRFLEGSSVMAQTTRRNMSVTVLPDLLGGIKNPKDRFCNFIIEKETQKLRFIDLYPLAQLPAGFDIWRVRNNYIYHLRLASRYLRNAPIIDATEDLVRAILNR